MFIIPIILAALQVILLVTVFNFDTPIMIKQSGEYEKLKKLMSNIYHPYVVQEKIDEIGAQNDTSVEDNGDVSYGEACCGP